MVQVLQGGEGIIDQLVGPLALQVNDEADATGVMFQPWTVQTLLRRPPGLLHAASLSKRVTTRRDCEMKRAAGVAVISVRHL
ncbi:hypothetical protein [Tepidiforma sp.]|uniref:hypothetical protein n=1 Tax=Tepidiforma sp. TaxID=2682230 RepID=UPI00262BB0C9|nr:hypothetical protein [Tepidiforma sp.]MCX7616927.1 hypothetical protein [Tepidiforma sp.]